MNKHETKVWIYAEGGSNARTCVLLQGNLPLWSEIGRATETQAKYKALIQALDLLSKEKTKRIIIYTDCRYLIGQLSKKWSVNPSTYSHVRLLNRARDLKKQVKNCFITYMTKTELKQKLEVS